MLMDGPSGGNFDGTIDRCLEEIPVLKYLCFAAGVMNAGARRHMVRRLRE